MNERATSSVPGGGCLSPISSCLQGGGHAIGIEFRGREGGGLRVYPHTSKQRDGAGANAMGRDPSVRPWFFKATNLLPCSVLSWNKSKGTCRPAWACQTQACGCGLWCAPWIGAAAHAWARRRRRCPCASTVPSTVLLLQEIIHTYGWCSFSASRSLRHCFPRPKGGTMALAGPGKHRLLAAVSAAPESFYSVQARISRSIGGSRTSRW
jgi:hypothetical protein